METLLTSAKLSDAIAEEVDAVYPLILGYIHEAWHELDGFKVPN